MPVHVFGIRHHGPGSARSLQAALHALKPDVVLIEGPPEAESLLPLLSHEEIKPPVALLLYATDDPSLASFYPQAVFSPEWQAIQFATKHKIPVRFIDLPQGVHFARTRELLTEAKEKQEKGASGSPAPEDAAAPDREIEDAIEDEIEDDGAGQPARPGEEQAGGEAPIPQDPLTWLARAAGFADGESWWEHMVEFRKDPADMFAAISEAMTALRAELSMPGGEESQRREAWREAHMRQSIRGAEKEFERIAVVCGAWHVPALEKMPA